jgi:hypothetical protein
MACLIEYMWKKRIILAIILYLIVMGWKGGEGMEWSGWGLMLE